ncbi:hypothetical protein RSSM_06100 [Rhodopirellula sallentina SM41]|uniref:Uncharacterized protein n=1 Tax=Rhodopirellula sallentina SM41 TaxID=1263870 RepID=M5TTF7_9BACT|nr:hypothetical protein RSSM_06100 [Rhodopirellula sallentina SM41]
MRDVHWRPREVGCAITHRPVMQCGRHPDWGSRSVHALVAERGRRSSLADVMVPRNSGVVKGCFTQMLRFDARSEVIAKRCFVVLLVKCEGL